MALPIGVALMFFLPMLSLTEIQASGSDQCNVRCAVCDDGRCRECRYGWYGHNCNSKCQNCWITGCHKHSGECVQCKPGTYGDGCGTPCPDNCRHDRNGGVYCRRKDGKCLDGCKEGWWGATCNIRCSENCQGGSCLQNNGHCINDCKAGWWGGSCKKECSEGCLNDKCHCLSGRCKWGCKIGFSGDFCNLHKCNSPRYDVSNTGLLCRDGCNPGYASRSCNEKCSDRCLSCHQYTKECFNCSSSFYGSNCQRECSKGCIDSVCDMNGKCEKGCNDGLRRNACDEPCKPNCLTCAQNGDFCSKCKAGWTGTYCQEQVSKAYKNISDSGQSGCGSDPKLLIIALCGLFILRELRYRDTSC